jgi:hypothetical protein
MKTSSPHLNEEVKDLVASNTLYDETSSSLLDLENHDEFGSRSYMLSPSMNSQGGQKSLETE